MLKSDKPVIKIKLTLDGDGLTRQINSQVNSIANSISTQLNRQIKGVSNNLYSKMSNLTNISGLGRKIGAALGGAAVGVFTKSCLELGSNLAEVQNVVDVTFGDMTGQVNAWARNAMEKFGLSETVSKKYLGTTGAMAKAFGITDQAAVNMAESITGLSADVASFYNLSSDEAFTKLKSIFTGETETLKDLGVVMSQTALDQYALNNGFGKTTANMMEQEKVMLRYQFVTSRLADASGDFARTSDGWANQTRVLNLRFEALKATIGQGLIRALTPAIKLMNQLLGRINSCAEAFLGLTDVMSGKSTSLSTIASDASGASDAIDKIGESADSTSKKLKNLAAYDELNVISKDTDTSTGSSASDTGTSGNTSDGSSTSNVDYSNNVASKYIDAIKKSWEEADFTDIGSTVSDKIGGALESIKWAPIKNTAGKLASSFATFLNGFFKPKTFESTGKTAAEAVNTAIHANLVFSEKFNFSNFGKTMGAGVNGYIKNINWREKLKASKNWGKGTANALNSFLKETDFKQVGKSVGNMLLSQINKAYAFTTNVDYKELGDSIAQSINGFFDSLAAIDEEGLNGWQKTGKGFNSLVKGLVTAIANAIKGVTWKQILKGAGDFLGELDLGTIAIVIGAISFKWIGVGAISALFSTWIATKISTISLAGVKVDADAAKALGTTAGGYIAAGIVAAVGSYNLTKEICKKIFPDDADYYNMSLGDILKYLSDTDGDDIKGAAKEAKKDVKNAAKSDADEIIDGFKDAVYGATGIDLDAEGHGSSSSGEWYKNSRMYGKGLIYPDTKLKQALAGLSNKSIQVKFDAKETDRFKVNKNWWANTRSKSLTATVKGAMTTGFKTVNTKWAGLSNKSIQAKFGAKETDQFKVNKNWWANTRSKSLTATVKGAMTTGFKTVDAKWAGLSNKSITLTAKASSWKTVKKSFSDLFSSILKYFQDKLVSPLKKAFSGTKNALGNMFNFADIKIPAFANGAFIKANTPQLAVVGDNTHEGEFVAPESKLKAAVREVLNERGTHLNDNETYELYLTIDGEVAYKAVAKKAQMRKKQTGNTGLT